MIYLITGVPGSGKTLYAVSTLVQKLAAEKIVGKDGKETTRRVVVDGIPDLVMPHEMMAPLPEPDTFTVVNGGGPKVGDLQPREGNGVWNWYEWCKPGDVIVIDEVQRHWRPRGMGSKVPPEIAALETHRHKGVDFVIVTQNPMLIDGNARRLVGRAHPHTCFVRKTKRKSNQKSENRNFLSRSFLMRFHRKSWANLVGLYRRKAHMNTGPSMTVAATIKPCLVW